MVAAHAIVIYRVRTSGSSLALIPGFLIAFLYFALIALAVHSFGWGLMFGNCIICLMQCCLT